MIKSLLDTDFYILTMMQATFHKYTNVSTEFEFKWRNWDIMKSNVDLDDFIEKLKPKIDGLCKLRFTEDELTYLSGIPFLKSDFIEYLRLFKLNRKHIHPYNNNGELAISIKGPLLNVIMFEVPVLAIVSQLYTSTTGISGFNLHKEGHKRLNEKLDYLDSSLHRDMNFGFADFGTRRRSSFSWHEEVIKALISRSPNRCVGTSNVYFAKKYNMKPIGTMAHLWFQVHQQLGSSLADSQKNALQSWADEYRGELGIALSDTEGFDSFLSDFDRYFSLLFDGCRHDSGDPVKWCEDLISHYDKMRIDPKTKTAVFSDGLTFEIAVDLFRNFNNRINTSFGIGTYLTNDCGFLAPQIVIKNTKTNGKPTAKISDSPGKGMCKDPEYLSYFKSVIRRKLNENKLF